MSQDLYNKYVVDLATDLKESQQYSLAIGLLQKSQEPRSLACYFQLSFCLSALGNDNKALRASEQALNTLQLECMTRNHYSKELASSTNSTELNSANFYR